VRSINRASYPQPQRRPGRAPPHISPIQTLQLLPRCVPVAALALSRSRAGTWSGGYPAPQGRLEVKPPLRYPAQRPSPVARHMRCIILHCKLLGEYAHVHRTRISCVCMLPSYALLRWLCAEFIAIIGCQRQGCEWQQFPQAFLRQGALPACGFVSLAGPLDQPLSSSSI